MKVFTAMPAEPGALTPFLNVYVSDFFDPPRPVRLRPSGATATPRVAMLAGCAYRYSPWLVGRGGHY
jgi:hypothetical protein